MKWAAPGGGANWTLINTGGTSLSGSSSVTISGISNKDSLMIRVRNASSGQTQDSFRVRFNGDTGNNYFAQGLGLSFSASYSAQILDRTDREGVGFFDFGQMSDTAASSVFGYLYLTGGLSSGIKSVLFGTGVNVSSGINGYSNIAGGIYSASAPITSFTIYSANSSNFDAGTVFVYGA